MSGEETIAIPTLVVDVLGLEYQIQPETTVTVVMQMRYKELPIDAENTRIVRYVHEYSSSLGGLDDSCDDLSGLMRDFLRVIGRNEIYARGFAFEGFHDDGDEGVDLENFDLSAIDPHETDDSYEEEEETDEDRAFNLELAEEERQRMRDLFEEDEDEQERAFREFNEGDVQVVD